MNNKRYFFKCFYAALFILCAQHMLVHPSSPAYLLGLKAPQHLNTDGICCLYHGVPLTFKDEYCILPEPTARQFFNLIITPRIEFVKKGLLTHMRRIENLPCTWFLLSLEHSQKANGAPSHDWQIEKATKKDMPLRIPDASSIVLCVDPTAIKEVKSSQIGTRVIRLPTIFLKDSLTQKELDRACEEACCFMPELRKNCTGQICACTACGEKTVIIQTEKPVC